MNWFLATLALGFIVVGFALVLRSLVRTSAQLRLTKQRLAESQRASSQLAESYTSVYDRLAEAKRELVKLQSAARDRSGPATPEPWVPIVRNSWAEWLFGK